MLIFKKKHENGVHPLKHVDRVNIVSASYHDHATSIKLFGRLTLLNDYVELHHTCSSVGRELAM